MHKDLFIKTYINTYNYQYVVKKKSTSHDQVRYSKRQESVYDLITHVGSISPVRRLAGPPIGSNCAWGPTYLSAGART